MPKSMMLLAAAAFLALPSLAQAQDPAAGAATGAAVGAGVGAVVGALPAQSSVAQSAEPLAQVQLIRSVRAVKIG